MLNILSFINIVLKERYLAGPFLALIFSITIDKCVCISHVTLYAANVNTSPPKVAKFKWKRTIFMFLNAENKTRTI